MKDAVAGSVYVTLIGLILVVEVGRDTYGHKVAKALVLDPSEGLRALVKPGDELSFHENTKLWSAAMLVFASPAESCKVPP